MPDVWEHHFPDLLSRWRIIKEPIGFSDVVRGVLDLHLSREAGGEVLPFPICKPITLSETAFVANDHIESLGGRPAVVEPVAVDFDGILQGTGSLPIRYGGTVIDFGLR